MKKLVFFPALIFFISHIAFESLAQNCYITNRAAAKPNPSLIQCYKNNPSSCCNSLADGSIQDTYSDLLSKSCARSYPWLEAYFCLACNPSEPTVADHTAKVINVCQSFLLNLWSSDLSLPTTTFDNCGMRTIWNTEQDVVLPSTEFASAFDFVLKVKPPFFDGYTIKVIDDSISSTPCYSYGTLLTTAITIFSFFLITFFV